jgi:hypothetical protein
MCEIVCMKLSLSQYFYWCVICPANVECHSVYMESASSSHRQRIGPKTLRWLRHVSFDPGYVGSACSTDAVSVAKDSFTYSLISYRIDTGCDTTDPDFSSQHQDGRGHHGERKSSM